MKVKGKERERKKEACLIVNKTISTSTTTTKKKSICMEVVCKLRKTPQNVNK